MRGAETTDDPRAAVTPEGGSPLEGAQIGAKPLPELELRPNLEPVTIKFSIAVPSAPDPHNRTRFSTMLSRMARCNDRLEAFVGGELSDRMIQGVGLNFEPKTPEEHAEMLAKREEIPREIAAALSMCFVELFPNMIAHDLADLHGEEAHDSARLDEQLAQHVGKTSVVEVTLDDHSFSIRTFGNHPFHNFEAWWQKGRPENITPESIFLEHGRGVLILNSVFGPNGAAISEDGRSMIFSTTYEDYYSRRKS